MICCNEHGILFNQNRTPSHNRREVVYLLKIWEFGTTRLSNLFAQKIDEISLDKNNALRTSSVDYSFPFFLLFKISEPGVGMLTSKKIVDNPYFMTIAQ